MAATVFKQALPLNMVTLRSAAALSGPCISIMVPPQETPAPPFQRQRLFQSLVQNATAEVAALKLARAVPIVKRWEEFSADLETHPLADSGLALICSPETLVQFEGIDDRAPRAVISTYPFLKPFVGQARRLQECLVLCLSRKRIHLFEFAAGICHQAELPIGVPCGLQEAGAFDAQDHQLQHRSSAGVLVGSPGVVTFGTGSEREHRFGHVEHFFAIVDAGIHNLLAGRPLVLAGVHEEIAAYRRVSNYAHIVSPQLAGNWDHRTLPELAAATARCLVLESEQYAAELYATFREKQDGTKTVTDPHEALVSAAAGTVHRLFVRKGSEWAGKLPPNLDRARIATEDLVNAAICETLRHGGEVFELDEALLPAEHPLAAILRF